MVKPRTCWPSLVSHPRVAFADDLPVGINVLSCDHLPSSSFRPGSLVVKVQNRCSDKPSVQRGRDRFDEFRWKFVWEAVSTREWKWGKSIQNLVRAAENTRSKTRKNCTVKQGKYSGLPSLHGGVCCILIAGGRNCWQRISRRGENWPEVVRKIGVCVKKVEEKISTRELLGGGDVVKNRWKEEKQILGPSDDLAWVLHVFLRERILKSDRDPGDKFVGSVEDQVGYGEGIAWNNFKLGSINRSFNKTGLTRRIREPTATAQPNAQKLLRRMTYY